MIAFSTCWNSGRHTAGDVMLHEIKDELGFDLIELGHGIRMSLMPGIQKMFDTGQIRFGSLHNFCPLPVEVMVASPDCYKFSAVSPEERERAIKQTFQTIDRIRATDPKAKWIVYNALELSEFIPATGADVIGGTKIVPDLEFLHRLDPEGRATFIYNRYAHVLCRFPPSLGEMGFFLMQSDFYTMEIDPNLPVLQEIGCRYFVLPEYWPEAEVLGFTLLAKVSDSSIWIYRRH